MKIILSIFAFFFTLPLFPITDSDAARQVVRILRDSYHRKPVNSSAEKLLLYLGKKTYFDMLALWIQNLSDESKTVFPEDPMLNHTLRVIDSKLSEIQSRRFRQILVELKILSLKNFRLYLDAVLSDPKPLDPGEITVEYIDRKLIHPRFLRLQKELYREEGALKEEMLEILDSDLLKNDLLLEKRIFRKMIEIRKKTIEHHLNQYRCAAESVKSLQDF